MNFGKIGISYYFLFVIVGMMLTIAVTFVSQENNAENYLEVTITAGDTLWDISETYKNKHNLSFEQFISWIEEENENIHAENLIPGQTIIIPVLKPNNEGEMTVLASK